MRNTVMYGFWFLFVGPICNIIIALLLFDVKKRSALKLYQTVMCFPNFMSMVVISFITYAILSPRFGVLNDIRSFLGMSPIDVYTILPILAADLDHRECLAGDWHGKYALLRGADGYRQHAL